LASSVENLSAANSRIRDTDVAAASADLAKHQILQSASIAVLSQANQAPNQALKLIS
jgi:flagellin